MEKEKQKLEENSTTKIEEQAKLNELLIKPGKTPAEVIKVINEIENYMFSNASSLTYTQMRNIYGIIRQTQNYVDLQRARPRIAYIQARQEDKSRKIVSFISDIMKMVDDDPKYEEFIQLMESIVAYHKLYEKKSK